MGVKTAGVGHFTIPTAPAAGTSVTSGTANTFTTSAVQLIASTGAALYITGVHLEAAAAKAATYIVVQLMIGAGGSETIVGQYLVPLSTASTVALGYRQIYPFIPVANGIRIAAKTADSVGSAATLVTLECIAQSNVVDDAIPVTTVTNLTNAPTAGDLTAAMKTSVTTAATAATPTAAAVTGAVGSVTEGVTLAASQHVIVDSGTVTTLTNLPAITAGWLTATGIAASALNDKGNWNVGKTGYALTQAFPTNFAAMSLTVGGLVTLAGVTHTGAVIPTVSAVTGLTASNLDATVSSRSTYAGGAVASVTGSVGSVVGLTASNLDATVSSRLASASYTAPDNTRPANFTALAITAGGAVTAGTVSDKTGYALSTAGVQAVWDALTSALTTVGSVGKRIADFLTGDAYTRIGTAGAGLTALGDTRIASLDAAVSTRLAASGYTAPDNASVTAIKAKTDGLAFTAAGKVDATVKAINDVAVNGAGTASSPWEP